MLTEKLKKKQTVNIECDWRLSYLRLKILNILRILQCVDDFLQLLDLMGELVDLILTLIPVRLGYARLFLEILAVLPWASPRPRGSPHGSLLQPRLCFFLTVQLLVSSERMLLDELLRNLVILLR